MMSCNSPCTATSQGQTPNTARFRAQPPLRADRIVSRIKDWAANHNSANIAKAHVALRAISTSLLGSDVARG